MAASEVAKNWRADRRAFDPSAMRALLFALALAALAGPGCAARTTPYRFSMPMLGQADVPPAPLPAPARKPMSPPREAVAAAPAKHPVKHYAYGWQTDAQAGIRVASVKGIELSVPEASEEAAAAVANGVVYSRLPAPHRPAPSGITAPLELPGMAHIREAAELRRWVGKRDKRDATAIVLGWLVDLGIADDSLAAAANGHEVMLWATQHGVVLDRSESTKPGDVL